jgi:hypothetical protein
VTAVLATIGLGLASAPAGRATAELATEPAENRIAQPDGLPSDVSGAASASPSPLSLPPDATTRGRPVLAGDPTPGQWNFGPDAALSVSGFLQSQYEGNQLSQDELQQDGTPFNQNRFTLRRARIRVAGRWKFLEAAVEIDANTTRGGQVRPWKTYLAYVLRNPGDELVPYLRVAAGITETPFGYELRQSQRTFNFFERSAGSVALFPGPQDLGVRLDGGVGPFRYDLAVMNGLPLSDVASRESYVPPRAQPDIVGRLGFDVSAGSVFEGAIGGSFLWGAGFSPGQQATKNTFEWVDYDESGTVDTGEISGVPGRAATPSQTFRRWAGNIDLQLHFNSLLGRTSVFGEVTLASNLDRGTLAADPIARGADIRQFAWYAAVTQELTPWALVGLRYDRYDGDSDILETRRGITVPYDVVVSTWSPLVQFRVPEQYTPSARTLLAFQYDFISDQLARDTRGVPTDLANNRFTIRLQGEFK